MYAGPDHWAFYLGFGSVISTVDGANIDRASLYAPFICVRRS